MPSNLVYHVGVGNATRVKATSLLLTLYGDALEPRAAAPLALAALIDLGGTLGLSARHVRTSVQRLTQADWLQAHRVGRRSYYASAGVGQRRMALGEQRIFCAQASITCDHPRWNFVVLGSQLRSSTRWSLSRELAWCGFGEIAPGVFAQHGPQPTVELDPILDAHGAREQVWTLLGVAPGSNPVRPDARVLRPEGHCAQRLLRGWQGFIECYRPLANSVQERDGTHAFVLRTQLVHAYRRLLQNHPELPFACCTEMQAARLQAQQVFARLYLALLDASECFLNQHLPPPAPPGTALLQQRVLALRALLAH